MFLQNIFFQFCYIFYLIWFFRRKKNCENRKTAKQEKGGILIVDLAFVLEYQKIFSILQYKKPKQNLQGWLPFGYHGNHMNTWVSVVVLVFRAAIKIPTLVSMATIKILWFIWLPWNHGGTLVSTATSNHMNTLIAVAATWIEIPSCHRWRHETVSQNRRDPSSSLNLK